MKSIITAALILFATLSLNAQISSMYEANRFNKFMNKLSTSKGGVLSYDDVEGNPFFNKNFLSAKVEGATNLVPARYNMYTDTIELMNDGTIYELPKANTYSKITFVNSGETFVYINEGINAVGYYLELVPGKYRLLKKLKSEFRDAVPALNSFTAATPPKFETEKPIYFIKFGNDFIKIPKNSKELDASFSDKKDALNDFIKTNKIKLNKEEDLIKLINFLNQ